MGKILSAAVAIVLGASAVIAQQPAPKPGAEHKRIAYFAGQWSYQGEAKAGPLGPGGKITSTETCEWYAGGFQLVCRAKITGPRGKGTSESIMSYDLARKTYTLYAFSSHGDSFFVRGQVDGKVWTWADDMIIEGKSMRIRATITEETPTSYSFKLEGSADGGKMTIMEEGKATKGKST